MKRVWSFIACVLLLVPGAGCRPRSLDELRPHLVQAVTDDVRGHFAFYLEDLESGETIGFREDETFRPWSLLKVAVMAAVLKKVEAGALSLDREIVLEPGHIDTTSIFPLTHRAGDRISVRDLLGQLIARSDNTASFALAGLFTGEEFQRTLEGMGMPSAPPDKPRSYLPDVSPRHFANLLRSLHRAQYLDAAHSALALDVLAGSAYGSQLPAGLPPAVRIAHMVGFNADAGDFHDGGIVYRPGRPYILCVMSRGSTREESDRVISGVSAAAFRALSGAATPPSRTASPRPRR